MSRHSISFAAVAMLFAVTAAAADRDTDGRDPAVREAQAARQEARQGKLKNDADAEQRERNRYARCDMLSGDDRGYCIRRMNGEGTVTGSVEGGGLSRELRVIVPAR
jgi:hypothetical protein